MKEPRRNRRESRIRLGVILNSDDPFIHRLAESLAEIVRGTDAGRVVVAKFDRHDPARAFPLIVIDAETLPARLGIPSEHFPAALGVEFDEERSLDPGEPVRLVHRLPDGSYLYFFEGDPSPEATGLWSSLLVLDLRREGGLTAEAEALVREKAAAAYLALYGQVWEEKGPGFIGWPVIRDMESRLENREEVRRIERRFDLYRLARWSSGAFLGHGPHERKEMTELARKRLREMIAGDAEAGAVEAVIEAMEGQEAHPLCLALIEWGDVVEGLGHLHGARAIYGLAYRLAALMESTPLAIDVAHFTGRASRKLAEWEESFRWYGLAQEVAEAAGDRAGFGRALNGVGNTYRDKGNFPRARRLLNEALGIAREVSSRDLQARAHHDLMALAALTGDHTTAAAHVWQAVEMYPDESDRTRAAFDLGDTLLTLEELDLAEDAYTLVRAWAGDHDHKTFALESLAHIAARNGDAALFDELAGEVDGSAGALSPFVRAPVLLMRGESLRVLGNTEGARRSIREALVLSERHGLGKYLIDAEAALMRLDEAGNESPARSGRWEERERIRTGLSRLREEAGV